MLEVRQRVVEVMQRDEEMASLKAEMVAQLQADTGTSRESVGRRLQARQRVVIEQPVEVRLLFSV